MGSLGVPLQREEVVLRDADTPFITDSQAILPRGITLQGCFAVPIGGGLVILGDSPCALRIHVAEPDLPRGIGRVLLFLRGTSREDEGDAQGGDGKGAGESVHAVI